MKTKLFNAGRALLFLLVIFTGIYAKASTVAVPSQNSVPPKLNLSVSIPNALESQVVRQDFENESVFSLKNGNSNAFLFSVTKVTGDQWMTIKNQAGAYSILENKDGFITFLQKTDQQKIKGSGDAQYQKALQEMDGMIRSIQLK